MSSEMTDATTQPMNYGLWAQFLKRVVAPEFEPRARREFHRYPFQTTAKAYYDDSGKAYKRTWRIMEVSLSGMMAKTHQEVPVDAVVRLHMELDTGMWEFQARVMHCTQTLGGYKVGMSLSFPDEQ